ncbi:TadE/TadG family type IV pilus assembly protein [Rhodoferax sp.]|uniref:TadE/TadG family type IV pilus assembly protein n=1 Tax=Rhodoferax sp. TaxID=50421 RepID=UPI0039B9C3DF
MTQPVTQPMTPRGPARQRGATLVEFVVVVPTLLFLLMNLIQYGLLYHTKGQLNYAAFEAARVGSTANADPAKIRAAFTRAMTGYHGGGTSNAELGASYAKSAAEAAFARIEILSPTTQSFDDYHSPALADKLKLAARVIPNSNLAFLTCPVDVSGCKSDPKANASGQTLLDANLLKLRITYGIAPRKQIPLAGRFMNWALSVLHKDDADAFRAALVKAGRIPVVSHTVMRMQSPAIENANASSPGPGNEGKPVDPGPILPGPVLPTCPVTDPACVSQPKPPCDPADPACKPPPVCNPATDPSCKPIDPPCDKKPAPAPVPAPKPTPTP